MHMKKLSLLEDKITSTRIVISRDLKRAIKLVGPRDLHMGAQAWVDLISHFTLLHKLPNRPTVFYTNKDVKRFVVLWL